MRIVYFDICSIPLFLMILFVCYSRKMHKGTANQLFLVLVLLSLFSAVADLCLELANAAAPLGKAGLILCSVSAYVYLILRNATNAVLLLFLLALTRTTFLLRKWRMARIAFSFPYVCILLMLVQNLFTHSAFTVTPDVGYGRGPLMLAFYGVALIYGLVGLVYCIYCRRYLPLNKWSALLSIYVLGHLAVLIQFFMPGLLLEMYCTAAGEMLIMLSIMRPEERMDSEVAMLSWTSYQKDLRNIILSGERVRITVIRMLNSRELRNYLGEHRYGRYLSAIADGLRALKWKHPNRVELYCERPGTVYLVADAEESGTETVGERLLNEAGGQLKRFWEMGVRPELRVCVIRCPEDLGNAEDILSLGHKFQKMDGRELSVYRAEEIVRSRTFAVEARIEEILDRAIREDRVELHYQPIYDIRSGSFHSAEALARIVDPVYGMISPGVFIPAAETQGFIIPIGDAVLDKAFRFLSEHGDAPGLDFLEVNLSVAQCMENRLPEKIRRLQEKYAVDPARIILEITETTFESIGEIAAENVRKLLDMGYRFALDDYGIGYSSIQRINHIPLRFIKIDKSMLDEISSPNGRTILEQTVRMMQSIGKQLVAEGAETEEEVRILREMNCDYIQGYYFSRPLPAEAFLAFLRDGAGKNE